jgi:hypothetical protein
MTNRATATATTTSSTATTTRFTPWNSLRVTVRLLFGGQQKSTISTATRANMSAPVEVAHPAARAAATSGGTAGLVTTSPTTVAGVSRVTSTG